MSTRRKAGLGRGLEALIPTDSPEGPDDFVHVEVDHIQPNPDQPRARFKDESIEELAASIRELGVLQPIVVHRDADRYVLVAGERRWRAAQRAGLETIPAVIREVSPDGSLIEALVENIQREDLSPLEEAHAYRAILENTGMNQDALAKKVGKSRSTVSNSIRLLQLPGPIQTMIDAGALAAGHARALLGLDDEKHAVYLADRAVKEGWSVRQVEDAVRTRREMENPPVSSSVRQVRPVQIIELEKRLAEKLASDVKIKYRNAKGKVEIKFASLEDLERIYKTLA